MSGLAIYREVLQAARTLFHPGDVVEVRVPKAGRQRTISGYFDNFEKLAEAVSQLEASRYPGVYWTLNPVNRALLSRSENRAKPFADATTGDSDILLRRWLPVDLDPKRPTGISSTDAEHTAALELAARIESELQAEGWPAPIAADSGNGAHLLYPVQLLGDADDTELLKRVLQALAARFDTPTVEVDRTTFNASRIFKTYGTVARKGDNTAERPHRLSRILKTPEALAIVPPELLRAMAATAPVEARRPSPGAHQRAHNGRAPEFDVEQFLHRYGLRFRTPVAHEGGLKYVLEECPFDAAHKAPGAAVFKRADGVLGFKCFHNSCHGREWRDVRERFEPRRERQQQPPQQQQPEAAAAAPQEQPITEAAIEAADVEAAIDEAISRDDLIGALRLAPEVGKLRSMMQAVIKVKLRQKFGREFPARDFDKLLQGEDESSDGAGQNSSGAPPRGGDGCDEPPAGTPQGPDLRFFPLTDAGNGERIAALFGQDIRYCVEMKKWLVWDGKRWALDDLNAMRQKGKMMARTIHAQAALEVSDSKRIALEKHARASESFAGISAALGQAATEKGVPISVLELDQQSLLLNCENGVVDLRTGNLLPHNREFLLTKLCPVKYDPAAKCPRFLDFIHWTMGALEDKELTERTVRLVSFLQRAFGSSLTGDVSDRAVFVFHGCGKNGKSTLLSVFRDLLGKDYSSQLIIDTIMASKNQESTARADMADLRGARFVMTTEVEKEHKLSEGKVKAMTAGASVPIKCKRLYENPYEFFPTHKLFMDCNDKPRVRGTDEGIWDRLKLVPFEVRISEDQKDKKLPEKLRAEMQGILAWAVRGCLAWQKEGLGDPPEVSNAGQEWREHDDPLKEFLDDCCEIDPALFVKASDLAAGYEWWAKQNRERYPLGREAFTDRLQSKKFEQSRSRRIDGKQARTWEGIELKAEVTSAIRRRESPQMWGQPED